MRQEEATAEQGGALLGLAALLVAMILSQFFRTALAVVAPELSGDLGLGAQGLGLLSGSWFLAFALAQLPVGVALDRCGPRRTVALLMLAGVAGCLVFASAGGPATASLGQALIGIGCAPVYMGTLVVLARWYPPGRFALLSSVFVAVSNLGNILGTTPLALLAAAIGWRGAFLVMAAAMALSAMAVLVTVRDHPPGAVAGPAAAESLAAVMGGVLAVMRLRALWPILPMLFVGYAVIVTLRGLWGGPYLAELHELPAVARGNMLIVMALAMSVAPIAYGALEARLDRRREPVIIGAVLTILGLAVLAAAPRMPLAAAVTLLTLTIGTGMTYTLLMAQGRRFLPDTLIGRGLTLLNGAVFFGVFVVQAGSGLVVELGRQLGGADGAYRALFLFLAACLALGLLVYRSSRDRRLG